MPRHSPAAVAATRRVLLGTLVALAAEAAIAVAVGPVSGLRLFTVALAFPTLIIAMIAGLMLAGERWPRLGDFTELHSAVAVALIMGSAAALLMFAMLPDPIMLILGTVVLGFFVTVGWVMHKAAEYIGF